MPQILSAASFTSDAGTARLPDTAANRAVEANHAARGERSRRRFARAGSCLDTVSLVFLVLAAGALTFRPSDLLPALHRAPIYEGLIALCVLTSIPRLLSIAASRPVLSNSLVVLAACMVPAVAMSHLAHGDTYHARLGGAEMLKACTFLMLVVALVDSTRRLHAMLLAVVTATIAVTGLALLHYHGVIEILALRAVEQANIGAGEQGDATVMRLCGIGVFNDPNDFSLLLIIGMVICGYAMSEGKGVIVRLLLLVPIGLFTYALLLTHSRGGLIAAVTALLAYLQVRFGLRNALPFALVLLSGLIAMAWGRQTTFNLDNPEDTFQSRLELWNHALDIFRVSPAFGVGQGRIVEAIGFVVHNSFLQAFAEMGLAGGMIFIGLAGGVLIGLWRARPQREDLHRLRPCIAAIVASYAMGLMSLSRTYTVPTQLVLGLGTAYLSIGARSGDILIPPFTAKLVGRVALLAIGVLFLIYLIVRVMLHVGG